MIDFVIIRASALREAKSTRSGDHPCPDEPSMDALTGQLLWRSNTKMHGSNDHVATVWTTPEPRATDSHMLKRDVSQSAPKCPGNDHLAIDGACSVLIKSYCLCIDMIMRECPINEETKAWGGSQGFS